MRKIIATSRAPCAAGPYSQAVEAGGMLFCSGQIGLVPDSGQLVGPGVGEQTSQCMKNLEMILEAAGLGLKDVAKTTIYLTDMGNFAEVNEAYSAFFQGEPPARSAVAVSALPKGAKVEIEAIAVRL